MKELGAVAGTELREQAADVTGKRRSGSERDAEPHHRLVS